MKKPIKVLSAASLAAVFTATAIVPVAAQAAEQPVNLTEQVILEVEGKLVAVSLQDFKDAKTVELDWAKNENIKSVVTSEGEVYKLKDFKDAKTVAENDPVKTLEILQDEKLQQDTEYSEAEVSEEDGSLIIADEQPEDRLNETFFYNVA